MRIVPRTGGRCTTRRAGRAKKKVKNSKETHQGAPPSFERFFHFNLTAYIQILLWGTFVLNVFTLYDVRYVCCYRVIRCSWHWRLDWRKSTIRAQKTRRRLGERDWCDRAVKERAGCQSVRIVACGEWRNVVPFSTPVAYRAQKYPHYHIRNCSSHAAATPQLSVCRCQEETTKLFFFLVSKVLLVKFYFWK